MFLFIKRLSISGNMKITWTTKTPQCLNDISCLKELVAKMQMVDGKYEVPMLWKERCKELPNNYQLAEQRLKLLRTTFQNEKNLFRNYKETVTFKATFKGKVFNSELHTGPDLVLLVSSKIPESRNHIRCWCRIHAPPCGGSESWYGFTAVFLDERNDLKCKIRYIPENSSTIRNNWTTMLWKLHPKIRCKDQL